MNLGMIQGAGGGDEGRQHYKRIQRKGFVREADFISGDSRWNNRERASEKYLEQPRAFEERSLSVFQYQ